MTKGKDKDKKVKSKKADDIKDIANKKANKKKKDTKKDTKKSKKQAKKSTVKPNKKKAVSSFDKFLANVPEDYVSIIKSNDIKEITAFVEAKRDEAIRRAQQIENEIKNSNGEELSEEAKKFITGWTTSGIRTPISAIIAIKEAEKSVNDEEETETDATDATDATDVDTTIDATDAEEILDAASDADETSDADGTNETDEASASENADIDETESSSETSELEAPSANDAICGVAVPSIVGTRIDVERITVPYEDPDDEKDLNEVKEEEIARVNKAINEARMNIVAAIDNVIEKTGTRPYIDKAAELGSTAAQNASNAASAISDKAEQVSSSKAFRKAATTASDVKEGVEKRAMRQIRGYSNIDIWNVGDFLVKREAAILRALSEMGYMNANLEWFRNLRPDSDFLNDYTDKANQISDTLSSTAGKENEEKRKEIYRVTSDAWQQMHDKFLIVWRRVGDSLYTEAFCEPITTSRKDTLINMTFATLEGGYLPATVYREDFQAADLKALSDIFYGFLRTDIIGYPSDYIKNGFGMFDRENGDWKDHSALAAWMFGSDGLNDDMVIETGDGYYAVKKNGEVGDYAAWVEDIAYAAGVLDEWSKWLSDDPNRFVELGADKDKIDYMGEGLEIEFKRVWDWIGRNIWSLWL